MHTSEQFPNPGQRRLRLAARLGLERFLFAPGCTRGHLQAAGIGRTSVESAGA